MVLELQRQAGILLKDSAAGQDEAEMLREGKMDISNLSQAEQESKCKKRYPVLARCAWVVRVLFSQVVHPLNDF